MGELSAWHWLIVIGVFVLLFGARKLPEAARGLGRSARILKAELRAEDAAPAPVAPATPAEPAAPAAKAPEPTPAPEAAHAPEATRPNGT
ncbi:Sec-independent protein translocase subunit TatA [Pseudonocardia sp. RS11V-5]|uniref:Sec-independent protein translocase subunit TatA n=1 Tax=Pseudonocardia terrae TaxID=2905831 RepID=UPI001E4D647B|nr:Sec-independent protein translocase subunit TatA [Pseudonocardia terrae]MCE3555852.1 Sec-independent protein translocase subunit TatA [Pseudonocardia terrae]